MARSKFHFLLSLTAVCIGVFSLPAMQVPTAALNPPLFNHVGHADVANTHSADGLASMRVRWVRPDFKALVAGGRSGVLVLNLFEDAVYRGIVDLVETNRLGSTIYRGTLENEPMSSFTLVAREDILLGTVRLPGAFYRVSFDQQGVHAIQQLDEASFPPELEPIPIESERMGGTQIQEIADDGSRIDVLVVYTSAARQSAGGTTTAIETLIDTAIAETNTGYQNSNVSQRLNLVHTKEVDYSETNFNWGTTLFLLRGTNDGVMDNVHTLRDTYCADEVVLLVGNSDSCGYAYVMQNLSTSFASNAFALVSQHCATGYYSFGHELGHNMGSAHNRANASVTGVYNYSFGYQDPLETFRTVMAYNCPGGCDRVNYWSNPEIDMNGRPMGVIHTDPLAADNHRSLNNTAYTVANFRPSSVCNPYIGYFPLVQK
jgi:hypothetical protein